MTYCCFKYSDNIDYYRSEYLPPLNSLNTLSYSKKKVLYKALLYTPSYCLVLNPLYIDISTTFILIIDSKLH